MHAHSTKEAAQPRWKAFLRLAFGQAQVIGAAAVLVLLLQGGVSAPAIWAVVLTGIVSLTSILLPRLVWIEKRKPKQGLPPVQGTFHWPPKT
jgi:hypothetical protein